MIISLITGITGQDGSYLAELLLEKQYKVYGIIRRHSNIGGTKRIDHIYDNPNLILCYGDCTDQTSLMNIFTKIINYNPDLEKLEVYNLAAQSHVKVSFELPESTGNVDALGTLRLLESIIQSGIKDKIRFYQASTSELYGKVLETPQTENTPFNPQSPYAIAKLYSYYMVKNYREQYDLFACNGILFNHTSPRRGETFCCRKITLGVTNIKKGKQQTLVLGNIYSKRDLGHAREYVYGMWKMLQTEKPKDYVLSMNNTYSMKEIVNMAFDAVDIKIKWKGEGLDEIAVNEKDETLVKIDPKYFRPCEVDLLLGDSTNARTDLGWEPKISTKEIIDEMVKYDLDN
jgi:GDPmannose 4,6-dehydratase